MNLSVDIKRWPLASWATSGITVLLQARMTYARPMLCPLQSHRQMQVLPASSFAGSSSTTAFYLQKLVAPGRHHSALPGLFQVSILILGIVFYLQRMMAPHRLLLCAPPAPGSIPGPRAFQIVRQHPGLFAQPNVPTMRLELGLQRRVC